MFKNNPAVDAVIFGTQWGKYGSLWDIFGLCCPSRPKVVSIKTFTISRDRLGLPDRNFSIQAIAVVPVFSVFFDRPRSSLWCRSLGRNLKRPG